MLEVKDISKNYKKRKVLDSVSISLKKKEILGLLGPNGVGKTTLLSIIMGFVKEDSGEILINGEILNNLPIYKRVKKGLSYLTQDISIIEELTVENNIKAVLQLLKIKKDDFEGIISKYLDEFEITHLKKQKSSTLSGGERRKLEIILSLLTNPQYILFDEPFTGLDPKTINELHKLILRLKEKNIGIIIVDHNYNEVMKKADRICLLFEGKKYFDGKSDDFIKDENIKKYYLGINNS